MQKEDLIIIEDFCINHKIEKPFVSLLKENGLIKIITIEGIDFIHINQIRQLEKYVSFYYELDINLEGIQSITHLLQHITTMQKEIVLLKNRLQIYETELHI